MPAAELTCACGHTLDQHDRPSGDREPWGGCNALTPRTERCDCREAWPVEEGDEQ